MAKKFQKWYVAVEGLNFLEAAGFEIQKGELVLQDVQMVIDMQQKITEWIEDEPNRLEREREKVKADANARFRSDSFIKQQELKKKIKANRLEREREKVKADANARFRS